MIIFVCFDFAPEFGCWLGRMEGRASKAFIPPAGKMLWDVCNCSSGLARSAPLNDRMMIVLNLALSLMIYCVNVLESSTICSSWRVFLAC